jgi:septum formation protein
MQLVLASSSPRRQQMLADLGVCFRVVTPRPEAEKSLPRHLPLARLHQLLPEVSQGKALDVAQRCSEYSLVVAADTVVYAQGQVLGKPGGGLVARRYLEKLSGRNHRVLSAVTVCCTQTGITQTLVETTEVRFRSLSEREIERYVASGEPLDKAGSYGIQGWGGLLVESIKGRHDNVVGFPLVTLEQLMRSLGRSLYDFATPPSESSPSC